jgi:two-component system chemotaxis family response regulator WspR
VLSTKEDPLIKSAAFAAGANDYLVKLPDNIELVARIRYHSRSYMTLLQRDAAYRALRVSQQQLLDTNLVLQRLMNSDGLTGLSNRRHFDEYLELEWRRAMREQSQLSLLMIDVDYFNLQRQLRPRRRRRGLRKVAAAIREASAALRTCRRATAAKSSPWCCPIPRRAGRGWWPKSCARPSRR